MGDFDKGAPGEERSAFERLIAPLAPADFLKDYWEERPLNLPGSDTKAFRALLSLADIEKILGGLGQKPILFTVASADKEVKRSDYETDKGVVDVVRLFQLFGEGFTLILNRLHTQHEPLGRFCDDIARTLSAPVQCNVYLSPPNGKGFKPHYDTHDVFIVQLDGSKTWRVYEPVVKTPMRGQTFRPERNVIGGFAQSFTLAAGDVAYIPRGWGHEGCAGPEVSLHLTVGVLSFTWAELFIEAVSAACARDPELRRALPPGFARAGFEMNDVRTRFETLWRKLEETVDADAALGHFQGRLVDSAPLDLAGQLSQLRSTDGLRLDTLVGARPHAVYSLHYADDRVIIRHRSRSIELPAASGAAVEFALNAPRFKIGALPDILDDEGKLVLARRLILEGLLMAKEPALSS